MFTFDRAFRTFFLFGNTGWDKYSILNTALLTEHRSFPFAVQL